MATNAETLQASLTKAIAERDKWLSEGPNGWAKLKPNSSAPNTLDYASHMRILNDTIDSILKQIAAAETGEAWELITEVNT